MRKTILFLAALCAASHMVGQAAFGAAVTGDGRIDFTDHAVWGSANGQSAFSAVMFDNVRVTLDAVAAGNAGDKLTTNAGDQIGWVAGNCSAPVASGLACDGDGIGVNDDEITGNQFQAIKIGFVDHATGDPLAVSLTRIELLDLFDATAGGSDPQAEAALYSDDNFLTSIQIDPVAGMLNGGTGYVSLDIDPALTFTSITFMARNDPYSDYAIARLTFTNPPVDTPEPAALGLFGLGLLALLRRRRARP